MKTHSELGYDMLKNSNRKILQCAATIALTHHEKYDGTGYPQALRGDEIPMGARIFAIADVFDALTSVRPYKKAFPLQEALDILLEGRGKHFDPELLERFVALAPDLHRRFAGDESDRIRDEVAAIVRVYFPREDALS